MKITTKSGFKCSVNENKLKDWRFVTSTAKLSKTKDDMTAVDILNDQLNFLLGEDQVKELIDHLSKDDGIVKTQSVAEEYRDICAFCSEQLKKSSSSLE